jgi:chromosome segregation ATPase
VLFHSRLFLSQVGVDVQELANREAQVGVREAAMAAQLQLLEVGLMSLEREQAAQMQAVQAIDADRARITEQQESLRQLESSLSKRESELVDKQREVEDGRRALEQQEQQSAERVRAEAEQARVKATQEAEQLAEQALVEVQQQRSELEAEWVRVRELLSAAEAQQHAVDAERLEVATARARLAEQQLTDNGAVAGLRTQLADAERRLRDQAEAFRTKSAELEATEAAKTRLQQQLENAQASATSMTSTCIVMK